MNNKACLIYNMGNMLGRFKNNQLDIDTEIILDRFGNIPYLNNMNYKKLNANREEHLSFINSVNLPELSQIKDIKLK